MESAFKSWDLLSQDSLVDLQPVLWEGDLGKRLVTYLQKDELASGTLYLLIDNLVENGPYIGLAGGTMRYVADRFFIVEEKDRRNIQSYSTHSNRQLRNHFLLFARSLEQEDEEGFQQLLEFLRELSFTQGINSIEAGAYLECEVLADRALSKDFIFDPRIRFYALLLKNGSRSFQILNRLAKLWYKLPGSEKAEAIHHLRNYLGFSEGIRSFVNGILCTSHLLECEMVGNFLIDLGWVTNEPGSESPSLLFTPVASCWYDAIPCGWIGLLDERGMLTETMMRTKDHLNHSAADYLLSTDGISRSNWRSYHCFNHGDRLRQVYHLIVRGCPVNEENLHDEAQRIDAPLEIKAAIHLIYTLPESSGADFDQIADAFNSAILDGHPALSTPMRQNFSLVWGPGVPIVKQKRLEAIDRDLKGALSRHINGLVRDLVPRAVRSFVGEDIAQLTSRHRSFRERPINCLVGIRAFALYGRISLAAKGSEKAGNSLALVLKLLFHARGITNQESLVKLIG